MRETSANGFRGHGPKTAYPGSPKAYHKLCTASLVPFCWNPPEAFHSLTLNVVLTAWPLCLFPAESITRRSLAHLRLIRISPPLLPTCPLWIQLFRRGMPSAFPPLLYTPTPPRHLCFGRWPPISGAEWMIPQRILAIARNLPTVSKNEQNHARYAFTLLLDFARRVSNHECWNRFEMNCIRFRRALKRWRGRD